jgi:hypothetical protein
MHRILLASQGMLMPAKYYKVIFTQDERQALLALVSTGKAAASKRTRARILWQAAHSAHGPAWSDERIHQALHVGRKTVERPRQPCVEISLEAALGRKKRTRPGNQQMAGSKAAHLIAVACSQPPAGQKRWTLHLVADKMVEWHHCEAISPATSRQHLTTLP